jgi:hypothetical protein
LYPNTTYNITLVPYNRHNKYNPDNVYNVSFTTLPVLSPLQYSNLTTNSVTLNFSGIYQYVIIQRDGSYLATTSDISYTDNTLKPDQFPYVYYVVPYNMNDVPGTLQTDAHSIYVGGLPLLQSVSVNPADVATNSAIAIVDGSFDYVNMYSYTNTGDSNNPIQYQFQVFFDSCANIYQEGNTPVPIPITQLQPSTSYNFIVIPFSRYSGQGTTLTVQFTTLPQLNQVLLDTKTSSSSLKLMWDGGYDYVICSSAPGVRIYDTSLTLTNLSANSPYSYWITPYNANDVSYMSLPAMNSALPIYTLPNITSYTKSEYNTVQYDAYATSSNFTNIITHLSTLAFSFQGNYQYLTIKNDTVDDGGKL